MQAGEAEIQVAEVEPEGAEVLVRELADELFCLALEKERVLERLDIRGARRARSLARDLVRVVVEAVDAIDRASFDDARERLVPLLEEAHELLGGAPVSSGRPPPRTSGAHHAALPAVLAVPVHQRPTVQELRAVLDEGVDFDDETVVKRPVARSANRVLGR